MMPAMTKLGSQREKQLFELWNGIDLFLVKGRLWSTHVAYQLPRNTILLMRRKPRWQNFPTRKEKASYVCPDKNCVRVSVMI
ncbi:hypothetical protein SAMN04488523_1523 [Sulfitobacter brevis]|uniref:Uncharacterized protein n=1 Tax=Sulfitobacter brevis TaxID=74348 RepID=A0A1I2HH12_9RHOB|nr:hypothetical protein SAMN04488523_1523 [Sulfitobacter brevis]